MLPRLRHDPRGLRRGVEHGPEVPRLRLAPRHDPHAPILEDECEYAITLLTGNDVTPSVLRAISRIKGCNYLAARRPVLNASEALFSGHAPDALDHRPMLEDVGIMIAVTPEPPCGKDGRPEA